MPVLTPNVYLNETGSSKFEQAGADRVEYVHVGKSSAERENDFWRCLCFLCILSGLMRR